MALLTTCLDCLEVNSKVNVEFVMSMLGFRVENLSTISTYGRANVCLFYHRSTNLDFNTAFFMNWKLVKINEPP